MSLGDIMLWSIIGVLLAVRVYDVIEKKRERK